MSVSHVTLARVLLLLPFIIPALGWIALALGLDNNIVGTGLILTFGIIYGGPPYLIFVGLAWKWMKGKSLRALENFGFRAPFFFFPLELAFCLLLIPIRNTWIVRQLHLPQVDGILDQSLTALAVFPVGYFYVVLAFVIFRIAEWLRIVRPAAA